MLPSSGSCAGIRSPRPKPWRAAPRAATRTNRRRRRRATAALGHAGMQAGVQARREAAGAAKPSLRDGWKGVENLQESLRCPAKLHGRLPRGY